MVRTLVALVAAAALGAAGLAGCGSGAGPDASRDDRDPDDRAARAPACDPELERAFDAWGDAGFSGSIAVTTGSEPDCLAAYGAADRTAGRANTVDTVFALGSVSKAFTAAAVLDLVDAGRLALDDRAGDLVPGLTGPAAGVTVEQLLLHTSGLTGAHGTDHEPLSRDEAVAAIGALDLAFPPGTDTQYSNAGYTLLALVVEAVADRPYRDHLATEILRLPGGAPAGGFWDGDPAAPGPRAVGYLDDGTAGERGVFAGPHWALTGNGDVAMTMPDLAAWTHALFTGGVVGPRAVDLLGDLRYDHGDGSAEAPGWAAVEGGMDRGTDGGADGGGEGAAGPFLTAAGGGGDVGHEVVVVWLPAGERVLAVASNTPDVTAGELVEAVGPALAAGDPLPAPEPVEDVTPAEANAVAGTYRLPTGGSFAVTPDGDRLAVAARGADAVGALFPLPDSGDGVDGEAVARHERAVRDLLAGGTRAGREERDALESQVGPIGRVELGGSVVADGELRTYVTVTGSRGTVLAWYALDEDGAVAGAEAPTEPPAVRAGAAGGDCARCFRPDDPAGAGPDVTLRFGAGRMAVTGPSGTTTARAAG